MKTNIPILILMINDSEFDLYRNEKFLPFTKSYLETYGLYRNSIFICNDEKSKQILSDNNIQDKNIFYSDIEGKISIKTGLTFIYQCLKSIKCDWFISMSLEQPIKNINIITEGIRNISDKYNMIVFSTYTRFDKSLKIVNGNLNPKKSFGLYSKHKIMDDSLFLVSKKFYMDCCENSEFDYFRFSELFWQGKYCVIDNMNEIRILFLTKQQIDNFIHFIQQFSKLTLNNKNERY